MCYRSRVPPVRLSFIDFLNSVPLGWGFLHGPLGPHFDVLFDVPSECARRLRDGEADVGLIPVIEYQRTSGLRVIPGISISSHRAVKSVLCVSRRPLESVRRIALDTSSRTSVALLKVLLARHFRNNDVAFVESAPDPERMLELADGALVIGNPALQMDCSGLIVYDLAREWHRFCGLPFVFAFWAVRGEIGRDTEVVQWLEQSKRLGQDSLPAIAAEYGPRLGLSPQDTLAYLTRNLEYDLGPEHLQGLNGFYDLCFEESLIDERRPLKWLEPSAVIPQ